MKMKMTAMAAAVAAAGLLAAGCGSYSEANDHKANVPFRNVQLRWERVETPPNYPSIVHSCFDGDGVYLNQDASNTTTVVPKDPACTGDTTWLAGTSGP